eukprot:11676918-Ditylum_brightwellii.AAC.1
MLTTFAWVAVEAQSHQKLDYCQAMLLFSWWWIGWIHFLWVGRDGVVDAGWGWWLCLLVGSELDLVEVLLKEGRVWDRKKKK